MAHICLAKILIFIFVSILEGIGDFTGAGGVTARMGGCGKDAVSMACAFGAVFEVLSERWGGVKLNSGGLVRLFLESLPSVISAHDFAGSRRGWPSQWGGVFMGGIVIPKSDSFWTFVTQCVSG